MAQRTEKEETEFKVPETLTLCANNCGVTGNPATNNMCQKCFNATTASSSSSSSSVSSSSATISAVATASSSVLSFSAEKSPRSRSSRSPDRSGSSIVMIRKQVQASTAPETESTARREVNRCSGCRRKVGLTGFRCRCGELFCADHRYSDRHDCSYDYKAAGREAIARENPVVKAAKIVRV
ncbi:zinc finger A20 and AN1 domain-containing stress-associated protein 5 [Punica granatum]|uniref:Uncharacterized protein n=2 Tax=Punica granatum TaxID=22663 RepID=A0A218X0B3_PUNGR|nr:zinc finger A20 and AN1 domain-containing stress-associated protein 5 [Punica granatum]OWM78363.1 hypothetical protein CDL15_Pgr016087 [Punica granatum]PKI31656.1 hypothetical protein CRG98_047940 [Punica granatum]